MLTLTAALILFPAPSPRPANAGLPNAPSAAREQATRESQNTPSRSAPSTTANTPPSAQWLKVEALQPGDPIAVLEAGRHAPRPCRLDDVTDDTLTCIVAPPFAAPRRIVYPLHSITSVFTEESVYTRNFAPILVPAGLGAFLLGAACKDGNAGQILGCIGLGAAIGAGVAAGTDALLPPRLHIRRRLIYQAP